ncbi:MAG TPA: TIGR00645 family protein [Methylophilaceae bacterium]|nr:TIGR00645 family protein [Methylophilaceae bacterium]HQR59910.1 TIGR00645 family protein [Methylophilaceae bacterium]
MKVIESKLENFIFNSRWLLAPFYIGLVLALGLLLVMFGREFIHFVPLALHGAEKDVIIGILSLIDVVMVANLLIIIVFAGYENFVSQIETGDHVDRPSWMGHVGFSELKMKLIGSIVAISGIELLRTFMHLTGTATTELSFGEWNALLAWKVGIHLTFVVTGVLFALSDRIGSDKNGGH